LIQNTGSQSVSWEQEHQLSVSFLEMQIQGLPWPVDSESLGTDLENWMGRWGGISQTPKLSVLRWVSSGDIKYSMVTRVNNTILYTWWCDETVDVKWHIHRYNVCMHTYQQIV
jgi:hypothetical protein